MSRCRHRWMTLCRARLGQAGAVLLVLAASAVRIAAAEEPPPEETAPAISRHVPTEAAVVGSVRLTEVEDGFAFADLLSGVFPRLADAVGAVRRPLGLPALSEAELRERGVRADQPAFFAFGRSPASLAPAALGAHHRLVVSVSNRDAFVTYAATVLERFGFAVSPVCARKSKPAPWAKAFVPLCRATELTRVGYDPQSGTGVALHFVSEGEETFALFDVVVPEDPRAKPKLAAKRFAAGIKGALKDTSFSALATVWGQSTYAKLTSGGSIALVLSPERFAGLMPPACRATWTRPDGAFFRQAALVARLHPFDWKLQVAFLPTPEAHPHFVRGGNNDGLIDAKALADAGLGAAILYTASMKGWLDLSRPVALGEDWGQTLAALAPCGWPAAAVAVIRHWPHLVTGWFRETLARMDRPNLLAEARNVAVGLQTPLALAGQDRSAAPSAIWMASFEANAHPALASWLNERAQGPAEQAAFGARTPQLWTLGGSAPGPRTAGLESLPGARCGLALSPEGTGLGWYYTQKRRPAVFGNRAALGAVHVNVKRLLSVAAEDADAGTRDAVNLATSQIGMAGGDLVMNGELLELDLSLTGSGI